MLSLTDHTALVTGAGQGVGRQIALQLAQHGAAVVVNDFYADRAETVAKEIADAGGSAKAVTFDVADYAAVAAGMEAAERFGTVDILVNNAGNAGPRVDPLAPAPPFWETGPADWSPWLATNLHGVLNTTRAAVPGMIERGWGRVINLMSDAGRVGEPNLVVYGAAKAGVGGFTRGLAKALGRHGVTANCVALASVRTEATAALLDDPAAAKKVLSNYVIRRLGEPEDVANLVLFLASGASSWITGQTYPVNGGYSFAV
ncbi:SDR family NAD(P)-dependent oxidoreductase [Nonomuraea jabiensis]|uniref:SDR family NAD(P)-dependent oxidoreductase n=1 Tax=Nonomuraea jabiensis TaxID=882448 RepID=UPI003438AE49